MKKSSLRISSNTRERLKKLKINTDESYDVLLTRILDAKLGNMIITYRISDKYNTIYATIDYDKDERNIVFEYDDKFYDNVRDLPLPIPFKKNLARLDLFKILPLLDYKQERVMSNRNTFIFENITEDAR